MLLWPSSEDRWGEGNSNFDRWKNSAGRSNKATTQQWRSADVDLVVNCLHIVHCAVSILNTVQKSSFDSGSSFIEHSLFINFPRWESLLNSVTNVSTSTQHRRMKWEGTCNIAEFQSRKLTARKKKSSEERRKNVWWMSKYVCFYLQASPWTHPFRYASLLINILTLVTCSRGHPYKYFICQF